MPAKINTGLREFGWDFDTAAPPHYTTAQNLAPNESLLHRLRLQMTSFTQDGSGHTEMLWLHFCIVEGSGYSHFFFYKEVEVSTSFLGSGDVPSFFYG